MKNVKKETIKVKSEAIKKAKYHYRTKILSIKFHNGEFITILKLNHLYLKV